VAQCFVEMLCDLGSLFGSIFLSAYSGENFHRSGN